MGAKSTMKSVTYIDQKGRKWRRWLPDTVSEERANLGVPGGPVPLDKLAEEMGMPEEIQTRLHNALFERGIFTKYDAVTRRQDIVGAFTSVFKLDAQRIIDLFDDGI